MKKTLLCIGLLAMPLAGQSNVFEVPETHVQASGKLKPFKILIDDSGFSLLNGQKKVPVPKFNLDKSLRENSSKALSKSIASGKIYLTLTGDEANPSIKLNVRGPGGGIGFGFFGACHGAAAGTGVGASFAGPPGAAVGFVVGGIIGGIGGFFGGPI